MTTWGSSLICCSTLTLCLLQWCMFSHTSSWKIFLCFQSLCTWRQDIWCHLWSLLTKASSNSWKRLPCLCSSHYLPPHRVIDSFFVLPCMTCWVSSSTLMTWNLFSKANLCKSLSFTHTFACGYREHSQHSLRTNYSRFIKLCTSHGAA